MPGCGRRGQPRHLLARERAARRARGLPTVVRAAPHYYNSEDEIAKAARLVAEIAHE
jgi:selenocysteine lyase/cysteine desulfurase